MALPATDMSAWGAYDLVAAYIIRDFLEFALDKLPVDERGMMKAALAEIDEKFIRETESDGSGRAARLDERNLARCDWWWSRIPIMGPVRDDLITLTGGLGSAS